MLRRTYGFAVLAFSGTLLSSCISNQDAAVSPTIAAVVPPAQAVQYLQSVNQENESFAGAANCNVNQSGIVVREMLRHFWEMGLDPNSREGYRLSYPELELVLTESPGGVTAFVRDLDDFAYHCILWIRDDKTAPETREVIDNTATAFVSLNATLGDGGFWSW